MNQQLLQLHAQLACLFPGQHVAINISVGNYITDDADCTYTLSISPIGGDFKVVAAQFDTTEELIKKATEYAKWIVNRTVLGTTQPHNNTPIPAAS